MANRRFRDQVRRIELEVPEWMIWTTIAFWILLLAGIALLIRR